MKKIQILGVAVAVVLSLGSVPVFAVSSEGGVSSTAVLTTNDLVSAVAEAELALDATVGISEVAAMRVYLQNLVAQARRVDFASLSVSAQKELIAALKEGACGLRLTAGVDRKVAAGVVPGASSASAGEVAAGVVAEPRVLEELSNEEKVTTSSMDAAEKVAVSSTNVAEVTAAQARAVAQENVTEAPSAGGVKSEVAAVVNSANLAVVQAKQVAAQTASGVDEVEVPKTGLDEEEVGASSAVRGIGLILGGAVVLAAAAGAALIVKRMKRGM